MLSRILNGGPAKAVRRRAHRYVYDQAVTEALVALWEASDRVCGKRLKALLNLLVPALERHGHVRLEARVRDRLMTVSAATIDRRLAETWSVTAVGGAAERRETPCAARSPCAPSPTGRIHHRASSRSTWWCTAAGSWPAACLDAGAH